MDEHIKKCLVCKKKVYRKAFKNDFHFSMIKFCSKDCRLIFNEFKRNFPNCKNIHQGFSRGVLFETFVKKLLENEGYYIIRSHLSKGIFDLIGFKDNIVYGFDVTTNKYSII